MTSNDMRPDMCNSPDPFIKAYHEFRDSIDFSKSGVLPDPDNMVCYLLVGLPRVPADDDPSTDSSFEAIDQKVTILKAVFIELNKKASEAFLDLGLNLYDMAGKRAKGMLRETDSGSD